MVSIISNIPVVLGQTGFILTCDVSGADNLSPLITYRWTKSNGTQTVVADHSVLSFSQPLSFCNAGQYVCQVTVMSSLLNNQLYVSNPYNVLTLQGEVRKFNFMQSQ